MTTPSEPWPSTLAGRLRAARTLAGLSGRALDKLAGRKEGHASVIESRPDGAVKAAVAMAYARALGVSLEWLVDGKGEPPTRESLARAVEAAQHAPVAGHTANDFGGAR
jgi:transcriptional regulator with XRE-family HTH domain